MFKREITFKKANKFVSKKYGDGSAFERFFRKHLVNWTVDYHCMQGYLISGTIEGEIKWVPFVLLCMPMRFVYAIVYAVTRKNSAGFSFWDKELYSVIIHEYLH